MPNWCQNRLTISAPKHIITEITHATGLNRGEFDFNGIVPMPAELHITAGSSTSWGEDILYGDRQRMLSIPWIAERFLSAFHLLPPSRNEMVAMIEQAHACYEELGKDGERRFCVCLREARQARINLEIHGYKNWYDWSIDHWGTKWNACDIDIESLEPECFTLHFSTAWSPPIPVIDALCSRYPDIEAELSHAETGNWFAGRVYGSEGCISDEPANDVKSFCETEFGYEFDTAEEEESLATP